MWPRADRVEARFPNSKRDQFREEPIVTRAGERGTRALTDEGGAVDLMVELMSRCSTFGPSLPLGMYPADDSWTMWAMSGRTDITRGCSIGRRAGG